MSDNVEASVASLQKVFGYLSDLRVLTRDLDHLSQAFYIVGNEKVGHELAFIATNITKTSRNIRKELDEERQRDYKRVMNQTGNILSTLLEVSEKKKEQEQEQEE